MIQSFIEIFKPPTQPQLNSTSTLHNLSRVWHENDFAHPTHHTNSMSAISQLLLTAFWWNFKGHGDICQNNICPDNICPYQKYFSCYSPIVDQTLKIGSFNHF